MQMEITTQNLKRDELVTLELRGLFERRGFRQVSVSKFEEYSLYVDNKNFLQSDNVISFMDMEGKLLALKPDVTLSVVKNIPRQRLPSFEKLYYVDEVYRISRENREYRVHNQIGVELLGETDVFASIEVLDLALESLGAIGRPYLLDISHLGFVSGLLRELELPHRAERQVLQAIHAKNTHELDAALEGAGVAQERRSRVIALSQLHGSLLTALEQAKPLIANDEMRDAWDELCAVGKVLDQVGHGQQVQLDFSVVNDLDYYNGLIFLGYVQGLPQVVLTGGRYDNLMRKMGKESGAIGFGVSLDLLNTYFKSGRDFDFDILITYHPGCDFAALLNQVRALTEGGSSVRLERWDADTDAAGLTFRRRMRFEGRELLEEGGGKTC